MKYVYFPRWAELLKSVPLDPSVKQDYRRHIIQYLVWCRERNLLVTNESARNHLKELEAEEKWSEERAETYKNAIRWFFKHGERKPVQKRAVSGKRKEEFDPEEPCNLSELEADWEKEMVTMLRRRGMALRTERSYLAWGRRFAERMSVANPLQASEEEVCQFLDILATELKVAPSTQKQALNALVFLLREVAQRENLDLSEFRKAKSRKRMPIVLDREEVKTIFRYLTPRYEIMAKVQYGSGMRISELIRLRVKDVDFRRGQIVVRAGKGNKDRIVPLPRTMENALQQHLDKIHVLYERDRKAGLSGVYLPEALSRKYPHAAIDWPWQWVWPSREVSTDPRTGVKRRHHVQDRPYQSAIRRAAKAAGLNKRVTSHTLRHSFATHLLESGIDIRTVQDLLGHAHVETTMVYLHVMQKPGAGSQSPLDGML